jgi:hypothetical protein
VKHLNSLPVDTRRGGQGIEKFELRSSSGGNDPRAALFGDGIPDLPSSLLSRSVRKREFVFENFDDHRQFPLSAERKLMDQVHAQARIFVAAEWYAQDT